MHVWHLKLHPIESFVRWRYLFVDVYSMSCYFFSLCFYRLCVLVSLVPSSNVFPFLLSPVFGMFGMFRCAGAALDSLLLLTRLITSDCH